MTNLEYRTPNRRSSQPFLQGAGKKGTSTFDIQRFDILQFK